MPSAERVLVLKESPWPLRLAAVFMGLLGALFVAGASGFPPSVDFPPTWERWCIGLIGVAGIACVPAAWRRAPNRSVTINPERREILIVESAGSHDAAFRLTFDEVVDVEEAVSRDDEGYEVYRPVLRLRSGGTLPLRSSWSVERLRVETVLNQARALLGTGGA